MLNLFFKSKDYKEVTVKYLDKITNDIEKLQFKRMTAANEKKRGKGAKNSGSMDPSTITENPMISTLKRDPNRNYEGSAKEVTPTRPNRSFSQGAKGTLLLADFQETTSSTPNTTTNNETTDSCEIAAPSTKKGHAVSRKAMADSIEGMVHQIDGLKKKVATIMTKEDVKKLSDAVDLMQEEISGMKDMMALIIAESRKETSMAGEISDKMQEEIELLKVKMTMISATYTDLGYGDYLSRRLLSCRSYRADDTSSDVDEKENSTPAKKRERYYDNNNGGGTCPYIIHTSYTGLQEFGSYFSFTKCISKNY